MDKRKSIQVDLEIWRELKRRSAVQEETIGDVVAGLVEAPEGRRGESKAKSEVVKIVELPKAAEWMKAEVYTPPVEPTVDEEARCVCGQRLRDHQGGASKRLAVATNCRNFREA